MTDINTELGLEQEAQLRAEFGESQVKFLKLDVRDEAEWLEVWEEAERWLEGAVDVLINNAGLFSRTDWRPMFEVNLGGLIVGSLLAISRMGVRGGGRGGTVLNTASLAGILTGAFHSPVEEVSIFQNIFIKISPKYFPGLHRHQAGRGGLDPQSGGEQLCLD